jgi:hypothetical protein
VLSGQHKAAYTTLEDIGVDGKIAFKEILKKLNTMDADWIQFFQVRDQWLALVKNAMNCRLP